MPNNELEHYGVIGMKWGVRKARTSSGSGRKTSGSKKTTSSRGKVVAKKQKKLTVEQRMAKLGKSFKKGSATASKKLGKAMSKLGKKTGKAIQVGAKTAVRVAREQLDNDPTSLRTGKTKSADKNNTILRTKSGREIVVSGLTQSQKSKLGQGKLKMSDLSDKQLKAMAERMKFEKEIRASLGPMTDYERKKATVERIRVEQEYRRLTAKPDSGFKKLRKAVWAIGKSSAQKGLQQYADAQAREYARKKLLKKGIKM